MITDEMIKSLTDEERSVLLKLYQKISEEEFKKITEDTSDIQYHATEREPTTEEIINQIEEESRHQYDQIKNGGSLLDAPVELVFNVNCAVFEKNNVGEIVNHNEIFIKTYHVPLTNQEEIKEYIDAFFKKFTVTLEETAKEVIN